MHTVYEAGVLLGEGVCEEQFGGGRVSSCNWSLLFADG